MRVLLPTSDAPPARGGVARYIGAIVETFPDDVTVFSWDGVPGYRAIFSLLWSRRRTYDSVWGHHILPIGTVAWFMRCFTRRTYVIFLHGMDFDLARRSVWKRWLTCRILRGARAVVTNSHALAREVSVFARVPEPLVVYPCADDALVAAAETSFAIVAQDRVRLLTVGQLVERKGHLRVLEAMKDDARLDYTIVGDGPMRAAILAKIQEYGISSRVHLRTDVADADLPDVYRAADVFVMPSAKSVTDREGFGIVYIEAALFGVPSIAVRQPGVDEAVIDGKTGWLIDDSVGALRNVFHMLADRSLRETLGRQSRERVLADFTRTAQFARLEALL